MPAPPHATFEIAPAEFQAAALGLVFRDLWAPETTTRQIQELVQSATGDAGVLGSLWIARRGPDVVGATWGQPQPGGSATVWPPRLAQGEDAALAAALLENLLDQLATAGTRFAQALLREVDASDAENFEAAGFAHLANLQYLLTTPGDWPDGPPNRDLVFESCPDPLSPRLQDVVRRTHDESLDCPGLGSLRGVDDLLVEYRAIGVFDPQLWRIVRQGGRDVGCVLLANHPDVPHWELIYMGLVPEARGQGLGKKIVREAQWLARAARQPRIVLAVDTANWPAKRMYESSGFVAWDNRRAYLRKLDAPAADR